MNTLLLWWAIMSTLAFFYLMLLYFARVAEVESLREELKQYEGLN